MEKQLFQKVGRNCIHTSFFACLMQENKHRQLLYAMKTEQHRFDPFSSPSTVEHTAAARHV